MELFIGSCQQTDQNITLLLDSLLESEDNDDQQTIANLLQMNERLKQIQQKYDHILQEFGCFRDMNETIVNPEEYSARQLVSQLSAGQLSDLLYQSDVNFSNKASKSKLEDLVVEHG